ncbi:hypothetical protein DSM3645_17475 [Blastopirellula marina DSM 3645]|uniref:Uncharacterized protein n=1 Tax=Blastopirellula marina DSM 3645 TaxID=314230 RepID=A3ZNR7_9BACT|nr:hypothetical protein DSM3645_17475 [Blastopirellula marina DSM 3645]
MEHGNGTEEERKDTVGNFSAQASNKLVRIFLRKANHS